MVRDRDDIYSRSQDVAVVLGLSTPLALTSSFQTVPWDVFEVFIQSVENVAGELEVVGYLNGKNVLHSIVVNAEGPAPTFGFDWDYQPNVAGNPSSGEARHEPSGETIRFHQEDDGGTDRSAELDLVTAGWRIQLGTGGVTYAVVDVNTAGSVYLFDVVPTTFASAGITEFCFKEPMPNPTLEVELQQDEGSGWNTIRSSKAGNGAALIGMIIAFPTLLVVGHKFRVRAKDDTGTMTTTPLGTSWSLHALL